MPEHGDGLNEDDELTPLGAAPTLPAGRPPKPPKDRGGGRRRRRTRVGSRHPSHRRGCVLLALAPAFASGLKKTPRDRVGISYGGGPIEGSHFQRIVQPGHALFFNGLFDPLYLYPADQQSYIVSKTPGVGNVKAPDSIIAPTKDRVQVEYQIAAYFKLNTDRLRDFHEQLGLRYKAYTSSGWANLIRDTFRQQIENALQQETRKYDVADIYSNEQLLTTLQNDVQTTISQRLTAALGEQYFCGPTFKPGSEVHRGHLRHQEDRHPQERESRLRSESKCADRGHDSAAGSARHPGTDRRALQGRGELRPAEGHRVGQDQLLGPPVEHRSHAPGAGERDCTPDSVAVRSRQVAGAAPSPIPSSRRGTQGAGEGRDLEVARDRRRGAANVVGRRRRCAHTSRAAATARSFWSSIGVCASCILMPRARSSVRSARCTKSAEGHTEAPANALAHGRARRTTGCARARAVHAGSGHRSRSPARSREQTSASSGARCSLLRVGPAARGGADPDRGDGALDRLCTCASSRSDASAGDERRRLARATHATCGSSGPCGHHRCVQCHGDAVGTSSAS